MKGYIWPGYYTRPSFIVPVKILMRDATGIGADSEFRAVIHHTSDST